MLSVIRLQIIFFLFLLQARNPCIEVPLLENEKFWFSNYESGDRLIFKSQENDFDTLFISNKLISKPTGECNPLVSNFDREFVRVDYSMKKDTFKLVEDYFIQLSGEEYDTAIPTLRFLNIEYSSLKLGSLKPKVSEFNSEWDNVYTFSKDNCPYMNLNGRFRITEFEWDKNVGLISYKNAFDEKWVLFSKEHKLLDSEENDK